MRVPEDADRDFVASCLVVENGKLLLVDHGRYDAWLPPGGHVDPGETPDETAARETREEVGLEVEIVDEKDDISGDRYFGLPRPFNVNVHRVEDGHWHCDFLYRATIRNRVEAPHSHEHDGERWFTREELGDESFDIPEYIRKAGRRAVESLERSS